MGELKVTPLMAGLPANSAWVFVVPGALSARGPSNGLVLLIDTGMLASAYQGRASALEIVGDRLTAIYDDGRVPLVPAVSPAPVARGVFEHQGQ